MDSMAVKILLLGLLCLVMAGVMYLLYINGWMILSSKTAASFVGSRGAKAATFSRCSGSVKRIVRFPEDSVYAFSLESMLTKGSMTVVLLDPDKREILCLDGNRTHDEVKLEQKKRYTLILRFHSATGRYDLQWNGTR